MPGNGRWDLMLSLYFGDILAISNPCCRPQMRDVVGCVPVVVCISDVNVWLLMRGYVLEICDFVLKKK